MPRIFLRNRYLTFNDIERNPYMWKDPQYKLWCKEDDERLLLIALDRYVEDLKNK